MKKSTVESVQSLFLRNGYSVKVMRYFIDPDGGVRYSGTSEYFQSYKDIRKVMRLSERFLKMNELLNQRNIVRAYNSL